MTITTPFQVDQLPAVADELYAFRDRVSGMWLRFYNPARRFDLWRAYVEGACRTYRQFRVESALRLPDATPESAAPIFAVVTDDDGYVQGGWHINGPLRAVSEAIAPREFASEPLSASLVSEWIANAVPEGVIEVKAVWVEPTADMKPALADLTSRAFVHAMHCLGVRYAFCTAAEHAAPRWSNSGARELPGIVPAAYPDDRYRTTFLCWDMETALDLASPTQRLLFDVEAQPERWAA